MRDMHMCMQAFGDAVLEEAPLLIISNYDCTLFLRRSLCVQDTTLYASPPVWWDDERVPPRICWLHALRKAAELRERKQRLAACLVPSVGLFWEVCYSYCGQCSHCTSKLVVAFQA